MVEAEGGIEFQQLSVGHSEDPLPPEIDLYSMSSSNKCTIMPLKFIIKQSFQYLGRWYEAARFFTVFELDSECVTADYTIGENGTIKVVKAQLSKL